MDDAPSTSDRKNLVFSVKLGNFALLSTSAKGEAKDSPILPVAAQSDDKAPASDDERQAARLQAVNLRAAKHYPTHGYPLT